jgi:hypothetical protein
MARLILSVVLLASLAGSAVPGFSHTPEGWRRWQSAGGQWTIWLPDGTPPGEQQTFLLLAPGDQRGVWVPAWLGGAEIAWQGAVQAGGLSWSGSLADSGAVRGLVAVSEAGDWTLAALAPAEGWKDRAESFNSILRGEP